MKNNSIRYPLVLCFCLSILGSSACSSPPLLGETAPASSVANAGRGKLAMNFNLGDFDFQQINASDFIEVKNFHTQAAITDVARVRISLTSEKLPAPVTRDVTRNEINNSAIVINDLPVGPVEVSISLLDAQGGNLASEQKLVKVAADKITPVEFNLTLINEVGGQTDSPAEASTGGLAISINVKEETRIYGRVAISQPVVQVGEPVKIRVEEVQGDIAQFNFDLGNGSATKAQDTSILEEQTFSQPGVYQVKTKLKDSKGDTFVTAPVPIKVVAASSAKPVTASVSYQPKVTVKSSLTSLPIALQGQGTFDQNGEGFPPNIAVKLYFQRPDQGVYDPVPKTTDGSGRFTHKWSPSATAQIGTYSFWATYSDNGQTRETAKVTYRVDAGKISLTVPPNTQSLEPNFAHAGYNAPLNPFDQFGKNHYECTRFAWGRTYEKLGVKLEFTQTTGRHGGKWYVLVKNIPRGKDLKANSLAVWSYGEFGHVAFVEKVEGGRITFSEANWSNPPDGKYNNFKTLSKNEFENRGNHKIVGYVYAGG